MDSVTTTSMHRERCPECRKREFRLVGRRKNEDGDVISERWACGNCGYWEDREVED